MALCCSFSRMSPATPGFRRIAQQEKRWWEGNGSNLRWFWAGLGGCWWWLRGEFQQIWCQKLWKSACSDQECLIVVSRAKHAEVPPSCLTSILRPKNRRSIFKKYRSTISNMQNQCEVRCKNRLRANGSGDCEPLALFYQPMLLLVGWLF